jgi:hypothetical protein
MAAVAHDPVGAVQVARQLVSADQCAMHREGARCSRFGTSRNAACGARA